MTHAEGMEKLQPIFQDQFDDEDLNVTDATTAADVEDWDSLAHMVLLAAIEENFGIRFSLGEVNSFANVGAMADCIVKHLG